MEPCTDIKKIEKELEIKIPNPSDWKDYSWELLPESDKQKFV